MKNFKLGMLASTLNGNQFTNTLDQAVMIDLLRQEAIDALQETVDSPIGEIESKDFYDQLHSVEKVQEFSQKLKNSDSDELTRHDLIGDLSIDGMGTE